MPLEVFIDKQDILHQGCVVECASVSKEKIVLDAVHVKNSKMWEAKDWVFLCNSAVGSQTLIMQMQLMMYGTCVLPHPPACRK